MVSMKGAEIVCLICDRLFLLINIPEEGWDRWVAGANIQDALPELSPADRELLVSRVCSECFDRTFPPGGEDA